MWTILNISKAGVGRIFNLMSLRAVIVVKPISGQSFLIVFRKPEMILGYLFIFYPDIDVVCTIPMLEALHIRSI